MPGSRSTAKTSVLVSEVAVNMSLNCFETFFLFPLLRSYEVGMCGGPAERKCCAPSGTFSVPLPHFILQSILLVMIILANTLVISVTIYDKELHTIPNIGISSLALADLLLAVAWFVIQLLVLYSYQLHVFYQLSALAGVLAFYYYNKH